MSIVRAPRPESGFTVLDNRIINDPNLGYSAMGLLVFLLSKPDHWQVSVGHLCKRTDSGTGRRLGRDGVYAALKEIEQAGYITRRPKRADGGEFGGIEYVVSESPLTENPEPVPLTDYPDTAEPDTANPTQVNTDSVEKTEGEVNTQRDEVVAEGFEILYNAGLPKRSKQAAFKAWKRIVKGKSDPVAFAIELEADIKTRIKFQQFGIDKLHPSTYLNGRRWEDEQVDERFLPAQKNPQGWHPAGNGRNNMAFQNNTTNGESVAHESLHSKDYSDGATADDQLPEYLRH